MTTGEKLILTGLKYVGIKEDPNDYNKQIRKWIEASCTSLKIPFPRDDSEFAWCACFVSNLLFEMGIWNDKQNLHIVSARKFLEIGEVVLEPQMGDLVILERGIAKGHIGLYLNEVHIGKVNLLNGNSGDEVRISEFDKSRILGYRRL